LAERVIGVRLAIEGESEFRQKVKRVSEEIKVLTSSLDAAAEKYKDNADSAEALREKLMVLSDLYAKQQEKVKTVSDALENARAAVSKYRQIQAELEDALAKNNAALENLDMSAEGAAEEHERLAEKAAMLTMELEKNRGYLEAAESGVRQWERQLNQANRELYATENQLAETNARLEQAEVKTKKTADAFEALAQALVAAGVVKLLGEAKEALKACADAAISFESAITGVYKTVDGTPEQLAKLTEDIRKMALEIPLAVEEIASIAEAAGQLGIATENIAPFTRVIAMLSSSTNLTVESASESLAKFANITGLSAKEYDKLGAAIVELGNNFATTESDILNMAMRIASAGTQVGLTVDEIVGFAAALSSLGLEAEMGGTAFSTAIKQMQIAAETGSEKLDKFAEIAGMTREEFVKLWGADTAGAITAFIKGLGNVEGAGKSTIRMLEDVGLKGVRVSDTWSRLSLNAELLSDALDMSSRAFEENTALVEEASKRYETTESKIILCKNAANDLAIEVGNILKPAIENFAEFGKDAFEWATDFVRDHPEISTAIMAVATALGTFVAGAAGLSAAIKAIELLSGALAGLSPAGAIAVGIGALVAGLVAFAELQPEAASESLAKSWKSLSEEVERSKAAFEESKAGIEQNREVTEKLIDRLSDLAEKERRTAEEKLEIKRIVEQLNALVPDLNLAYDEFTDTITRNGEAIESLRQSLSDLAKERYLQSEIEILTERSIELLREEAEITKRLNEAKEEHARIQEELKNSYNDSELVWNKHTGIIGSFTTKTRFLNDESKALEKTIRELEDALAGNASEQEKLNKRYDELLKESEKLKGATEELADAFDESQAAVEEFNALLETTRARYEELYEEARKNIDSQVGLWDEFVAEVENDVGQLVEIWQKQAENLRDYSDNLRRAVELGVDEGLVKQWSDGSAESAAYVEQFMKKVDELIAQEGEIGPKTRQYIDEFNQAYRLTQQAKDYFALTVADLESGYNKLQKQAEEAAKNTVKGINDVLEEVPAEMQRQGVRAVQSFIDGINSQSYAVAHAAENLRRSLMMGLGGFMGVPLPIMPGVPVPLDAAKQAGKNTAKGYAQGIEIGLDAIAGAAESMARMPVDTVKKAQDMRSPSRVMMMLGEYTVDGYVLGIKEKLGELREISRLIAQTAAEAVGGSMYERLTALAAIPRLIVRNDYSELIAAIRALEKPAVYTTNAPVLNFYTNANLSPYEVARKVRRELEAMARYARA